MAGIPTKAAEDLDYPTSDGKPMAETDWHRDLMMALIQTLSAYYADDPMVYVSGNLLVFYEPGNRRRHLSPDVFVVRGVEKRQRPNYLIWEERKGPEVVIELTSSSTREEDIEGKYELYQDTLCVPEYFLFDPLGDYMRPQLQGYRLFRGRVPACCSDQEQAAEQGAGAAPGGRRTGPAALRTRIEAMAVHSARKSNSGGSRSRALAARAGGSAAALSQREMT